MKITDFNDMPCRMWLLIVINNLICTELCNLTHNILSNEY